MFKVNDSFFLMNLTLNKAERNMYV